MALEAKRVPVETLAQGPAAVALGPVVLAAVPVRPVRQVQRVPLPLQPNPKATSLTRGAWSLAGFIAWSGALCATNVVIKRG